MFFFFFFKQKTAYEMRISDWSSDVCSSDLEALRDFSDRDMRFAFVSNVDGTDFSEAVRGLDPAETLFIVCSKTFTTLQTQANAHAASAWCLDGVAGDEGAVAKHFVARSTNGEGERDFGIAPDKRSGFWDWVG